LRSTGAGSKKAKSADRCVDVLLRLSACCKPMVYFNVAYITLSYKPTEAVLAIRPWPTQTRSWLTQMARVIPMILTYTTSVGLP